MWGKKKKPQIEFDEIFLDASNIPAFDRARMEGTLELPLSSWSVIGVGVIFSLIAAVFLGKLFMLQIAQGADFREQSENNRLDKTVVIAERGVLYDRNGERLAWNETDADESLEFPARAYSDRKGIGQLIGYVSYPQKDRAGFYYRTEYLGRNGLEESYNDVLGGENGERFLEADAVGNVVSEHVVTPPRAGESFTVSLDAELSEIMHDILATTTAERGFRSGAGAMMDVNTGEIVALASFPSFDPEVMADGSDVDLINAWNNDDRFPFLNKVVGGGYTPGSIVKPFVAYAALKEGVVTEFQEFLSTLEFVIPNPYNPSNPSIFRDWRAHGYVNVREAIAQSSNVYFYYVGGGFRDQEGLGITRINKYMQLFGFGKKSGIALAGEQSGTVPSPAWKEEIFDDDWRLGDTYLTSIGQFGFISTPLQILRGYGAIANGGKLFVPHFNKGEVGEYEDLELDADVLDVVRSGMRLAVLEGTARSINHPQVEFAGKTGTAELGETKAMVNTWVVGYMPYDDPQYVFVLMMERGPRENLFGAAPTMRGVIDWMVERRPEYLGLAEEE